MIIDAASEARKTTAEDISESSALLFATVVHTAQTLMTLGAGAISIFMVFLSKRKAKH